ncbi:type VI secretion system contractile sheath large subunit [Herbaspirillum rubrisubalbicans]|nr:type VI secretion system contractile sheath large subunit [Herbaspirillum rubrisubalbicans]ALU89493.1 EvpB/family type VI secretion protein [Herbaspirillum rubrisubalbicans M1]
MTESIQQKLLRVRPPRVKITYDVETGGAMEKQELPFIVGIFADLSGDRDPADTLASRPLKERQMTDIDRDNFNAIMKSIGPRVDLTKVPKDVPAAASLLGTPGDKQIVFESLDDFEPMQIIRKLPSLNDLYQSRGLIRSLQAKYEADDETAHHLDALLQNEDPTTQASTFKLMGKFDAVAETERPALRHALFGLFDTVNQGADADKAKVYPTWSLMAVADAAEKDKDKLAKLVAAADPKAVALSQALAAKDTTDNRVKAKLLVEQLQLPGAPAADATEEVKAPFTKRDKLLAQLGFDPVTADKTLDQSVIDIKSATLASGMNLPAGDPLWRKPLMLLGLSMPDDDARDAFLHFADYLQALAATGPSAEQLAMVAAVAPLLQTDAARVLLWLHHYASQVADLMKEEQQLQGLMAAQKRGSAAVIDELVARIDQLLSIALTAVLHCAGFKRMEATWRGLAHLVFNTETSTKLKLRVFNATQDELIKDMSKAVEFDQSALFKLIYEAEYGTYGGFPYSLLIGDYELGADAADIEFLKKMSEVAASAHAPFIAAASTAMFGLSGFDKLDKPRDLAKIFENAELTAWREFREMEDSRYVTLVLPRVLLRLPYGKAEKRNTTPCEGINFEEDVSGANLRPYLNAKGEITGYPKPDNQSFLWGNAAFVLAERITNAFALYNWTAAIRGVEGGGLVENLPLYTYTSDSGSSELFCPIEVSITDRREKELNDLGFISLIHCKGSGHAAFFGGQTTNLPKKYFSDSANANAKISSMLPYILAASRFAHYIKVIMRSKIGSFMTRENVESFLNNWITNYVLLDDNAAQNAKAAFPLREASVVVTDVPGQPGAYRATVFLKPHFQLEELTTSIRLVADLPS